MNFDQSEAEFDNYSFLSIKHSKCFLGSSLCYIMLLIIRLLNLTLKLKLSFSSGLFSHTDRLKTYF